MYHVLGGRLSPLDGVGPDDLTVAQLVERVAPGGAVREVIVATNPSLEGEATALLRAAASSRPRVGVTVTRIARGLPGGRRSGVRRRRDDRPGLSARRAM